MYEYEFVKIKLSAFSNLPKEDYHEIIKEHAKNGWRLKQVLFLPFEIFSERSIELIFEKNNTLE